MRVLALVLVLAAVGSFVVSLASHERRLDEGWVMYTPLSNEDPREGIAPIDRVDTGDLGVSEPEIVQPASATYDEYDHMPWDDARLWLGLAIGFAASVAAVSVLALRRRRA